MVSTKSGKVGRPVINYNGSASYRKISKMLDVLSPYEFVKLQGEIKPEYANCAAGAGSFAGNRCAGSGCIKQLKQGFFFEIGENPQIDGMSKLALIIFGQEQIGFASVA